MSAIPLCLPSNWEWDARTGKCSKTGDKRCSLKVAEEAVEQLKEIKGNMIAVSTQQTGMFFTL